MSRDPHDILFIGLDPDFGSAEPVSIGSDKPGSIAKHLLDETLKRIRNEMVRSVLLGPSAPLFTARETMVMEDWLRNRSLSTLVHESRAKQIARENPPSVSVKVRQSGSVVVTVNLSRGGFTCFLKPPEPSGDPNEVNPYWTFGFAFRAPSDPPSSKGKDLASHRCGRHNAFMHAHAVFLRHHAPSFFAGTVAPNYPVSPDEGVATFLTLRALRSLRKSKALANVRWWTKESMDQAVALLREGPKEMCECIHGSCPAYEAVQPCPFKSDARNDPSTDPKP